ncbi:hypothetical protein M501DRAFT_940592 [Patellaria atrata CBS 101060]|uniref:Uncharacterized protein n=1 Tax=Patellaria atrata CBS 101060 TaxID=1346257 RepID=A0A9P4VLY2_9PEZI|nr:hypothetical protein M501DRAFT_940592 [Patellaria atrata CBS 101060]
MPHLRHQSSESNGLSLSSQSTRSADHSSNYSHSTAPTEYSQPSPNVELDKMDGASSFETYASSMDDVESDVEDEYTHNYNFPEPTAIPATPRDFADLFPSPRTLTISHDDSTYDGNMNLSLYVPVETRYGKQDIGLFHLRIHDLAKREFSFRRYGRDSGREICHSVRMQDNPVHQRLFEARQSFSMSLVKPFTKHNNDSTSSGLKRRDSGYESMLSDFSDYSVKKGNLESRLTNTIQLEFSNYAHIDVVKRTTKKQKHYDFEYWGSDYSWHVTKKSQKGAEDFSYHLYKRGKDDALAHIAPRQKTPAEVREEVAKGGWIPNSAFWFTEAVEPDVGDVIISTGMIALVDDRIRSHFHSKHGPQPRIPNSNNASVNVEHASHRRLFNDVFHRSSRSNAVA